VRDVEHRSAMSALGTPLVLAANRGSQDEHEGGCGESRAAPALGLVKERGLFRS